MRTRNRWMNWRRWGGTALAVLALLLPVVPHAHAAAPAKERVLATYVDIAQAGYEDALTTARDLLRAVERMLDNPTEPSLAAAKMAWRRARVPYMQTEVFRFGNPLVDAWEGRVNSWPLDEGLIDYVAASYGSESPENALYTANVIAHPVIRLGGGTLDAATIDKHLLADKLQEAGGVEANVATGYHAVEFLLWGQDLNGTGAGAGNRPATDFDPHHCTGGNCPRRAHYLRVATALLVDDLAEMAALWAPGGAARERLLRGEPNAGLTAMLTGMDALSYGELAGERMKLGVLVHDTEEEQDCFSDNTHWSHFYDQVGMMNVYRGRYTRVDGRVVSGPGLGSLVAPVDGALHQEVTRRMAAAEARLQAIVDMAETGKAYDRLLAADNPAGNKVVLDAVDALIAQAHAFERVVAVLGLRPVETEGSDALDKPEAVFK